jgi:hypothetical protein
MPVFRQQHQYLLSATKDVQELLRGYTGADIYWTLIQDYLRTSSLASLVKILRKYGSIERLRTSVLNLNKFIHAAPRSSTSIKLWRGTGAVKLGNVGDAVVDNSFSGYSLIPSIAASFAHSSDCCLYELTLPPNSPFLFIGYTSKHMNEYEVLLPAGLSFIIKSERVEIIDEIPFNVYECDVTGVKEPIVSDKPVYDKTLRANITSMIRPMLHVFRRTLETFGYEEGKKRFQKKITELSSQFYNLVTSEKMLELFSDKEEDKEDKALLAELLREMSGGRTRRNTKRWRKTSRKNRSYRVKRNF